MLSVDKLQSCILQLVMKSKYLISNNREFEVAGGDTNKLIIKKMFKMVVVSPLLRCRQLCIIQTGFFVRQEIIQCAINIMYMRYKYNFKIIYK